MINDNERKATLSRDGKFYKISFIHPLKRTNETDMNKRRVKRTLGIEVKAQAEAVQKEIDAIVSNPKRWYNLGDVSELVRSLWTLEKSEAPKPERHMRGYASISNEIHEQQMEVLRNEIHLQRLEIAELKAQLKAAGKEAIEDYAPIKIEDAVIKFLKEGTNASPRKIGTYRSVLNRFAKSFTGQDCFTIKPSEVCEYVKGLKATTQNDTAKQNGRLILALMRFATKGTFKPFEIQETLKQKDQKKTAKKIPLWLDENEWNELNGAIENKYVQALANLSYWSGFRPEELPNLQRASAKVDEKGDMRIEVCDIVDDQGNVFWSPKTANSYDKVHIHPKALEALKTLQDAFNGALTLFPCCKETKGPNIIKQGFRKDKALWDHQDFTDMYLKELRGAAKKLGWDAERFEKLDSRTPRRSCGKRELLATKSITHTALILRDTEAVVRKHYARLLATDTKLAE